MPRKGKLEFAIKSDKARVLQSLETRKNVEELFRVQVKISPNNEEMQWITVSGSNNRSRLAKAYMIALCDPVSTTEFPCEHDFFSKLFSNDSDLLRSIEADYAVVVKSCQNATARIQGSDELSVTLAMSKLGEIGCQTPASASGLDRQLSEAMVQQCDPTSLSDLGHQPEVVKRTMLLEIVKDDSGSDDEEGLVPVVNNETPPPIVEAPVPPPPVEEELPPKFKDPKVQEKLKFLLDIGYPREDVLKVMERTGPKAPVNTILDRLIQVSSSKPNTNARPKPEANARPPSRPQEQIPRAPISRPSSTAVNKPGKQSTLRYIVIDGSNVAMSHGRGKVFSCLGIQIVVNYFLERGHKSITAFVPAWRKETSNPINHITDREILLELEQKGHLVFTPSRRTDRKRILPYDDRFIVRLAVETNGIIVSNDYFRDLLKENEEYRDTIENRVLPYSFVENFIMIPEDPLGANGPSLDQFLMSDSATNHPSVAKPEVSRPAAEKKLCKFYPKCTFGNRCAFRHPDGSLGVVEEPPRRENTPSRGGFNDRQKFPPSYAQTASKPAMDEPSRREIGTRGGSLNSDNKYKPVNKPYPQVQRNCNSSPSLLPSEPPKTVTTKRPPSYLNHRGGGDYPSQSEHHVVDMPQQQQQPHHRPGMNTPRHNSYPPGPQQVMYQGGHGQQQQHSGELHNTGSNYGLVYSQQQQQQQQRYVPMHHHHMAPPPQSHHYSQRPPSRPSYVSSYSVYPTGGYMQQPPPHLVRASHMGAPPPPHSAAMPIHYEQFERDSGCNLLHPLTDNQKRLVDQAVSLLDGLVSNPEPKVKTLLAKQPNLTDLDTIVETVMRMNK